MVNKGYAHENLTTKKHKKKRKPLHQDYAKGMSDKENKKKQIQQTKKRINQDKENTNI